MKFRINLLTFIFFSSAVLSITVEDLPKIEYEKFMQKMMGGETKDGRVGTEGYEKPEFLSVNLFYQLNQLIAELDGIISASSQENKGEAGSVGFVDFEIILDDYE